MLNPPVFLFHDEEEELHGFRRTEPEQIIDLLGELFMAGQDSDLISARLYFRRDRIPIALFQDGILYHNEKTTGECTVIKPKSSLPRGFSPASCAAEEFSRLSIIMKKDKENRCKFYQKIFDLRSGIRIQYSWQVLLDPLFYPDSIPEIFERADSYLSILLDEDLRSYNFPDHWCWGSIHYNRYPQLNFLAKFRAKNLIKYLGQIKSIETLKFLLDRLYPDDLDGAIKTFISSRSHENITFIINNYPNFLRAHHVLNKKCLKHYRSVETGATRRFFYGFVKTDPDSLPAIVATILFQQDKLNQAEEHQ